MFYFNTFKIEHENRDFRKSLYFYIVRLGAGIILNQELTYRRHWGIGLRALASALIKALASARGSEKKSKKSCQCLYMFLSTQSKKPN